MSNSESHFWDAFEARKDLKQFTSSSLLLFALQMKFDIEDISTIGFNSITDGNDDKKIDLVYIDQETGLAVIAQTYISQDMSKKEAPANKASDLNTGISWMLSRDIQDLPENLRDHADELRTGISDGTISSLHLWYVHNLPESKNVEEELKTVEHSAKSLITSRFSLAEIEIQAKEVGMLTLEEWYESLLTPILISDKFRIKIDGGFKIESDDWSAYVTSIKAKWLYDIFHEFKTRLFSANVRDYLGSRKTDKNINSGIKQTAHEEPLHFWVYNNGITVLVNEFDDETDGDAQYITFKGISIVNGAQTTGAIGNLTEPPNDKAMVQIRFIKCNDWRTIYEIVKYNNSQNKINAPDFRSNDSIQNRLHEEFKSIKGIEYMSRRGGHEDLIRRRPDALASVTAGQALATFHRDPDVAYHKKTHIWESDSLYAKYFNDHTTAEHILFAYTLLKAIEAKKLYLLNKSKKNNLIEIEETQLEFYRKRGSIFMMSSAIARCLDIFLDNAIPNLFRLTFKDKISALEGIMIWKPVVDVGSAFSQPLKDGLADGFKNRKVVNDAISIFQSLISSTKQANTTVYYDFAKQIKFS